MFCTIVWCNCSLIGCELYDGTSPVGWLDSREVHISEGVFYIHTNLGLGVLKVLEYDEEEGKYLVECIKYGDYYYPTPENSSEYAEINSKTELAS